MKIYAPNGDYTGVSAGVAFARGVGELNKEDVGEERYEHLKEWFRLNGYGVGKRSEAEEPEQEPALIGSAKPLSEMNVEELKEVASGQGHRGYLLDEEG